MYELVNAWPSEYHDIYLNTFLFKIQWVLFDTIHAKPSLAGRLAEKQHKITILPARVYAPVLPITGFRRSVLLFPGAGGIDKAIKAVRLAEKQHKITILPARVYGAVLPITVFRRSVLLFPGASGIDKAIKAVWLAEKQHKTTISPAGVYAPVLPITVFQRSVLLFPYASDVPKYQRYERSKNTQEFSE